MFKPQTQRLQQLAQLFPQRIAELERLLLGKTNIYIDYANVLHCAKRLKWHIDLKRLKQFLDSFRQIQQIALYYGTLQGNADSENFIHQVRRLNYHVVTKPVKIMSVSINMLHASLDSKRVLGNFIKRPLLNQFDAAITHCLNSYLVKLNRRGMQTLQISKCNFDVEMGRDMLIDFVQDRADSFVIWSGDSDFVEPVKQLLQDGKQVVIFAAAGKISVELSHTRAQVFEINKIRDFICRASEISATVKPKLR